MDNTTRFYKDLTSKKFGRLLVLSFDKRENKVSYWTCQCECGNIKSINGYHLSRGETKSCGCLKKNKGKYSTYKDISSSYWTHLENNAIKRNLEFSISQQYAWRIFQRQKQKCCLTGWEIQLTSFSSKTKHLQTASLDRIDNSKGYIKGNIQWLHKHVNQMKHKYENEYFIKMCLSVAKNKG